MEMIFVGLGILAVAAYKIKRAKEALELIWKELEMSLIGALLLNMGIFVFALYLRNLALKDIN